MSSFDFDVFDGDFPLAVSKERYTFRAALDIAISELGTQNLAVKEMYVYYGLGADDDISEKPRNNWWLVTEKPKQRGCPVWAFQRLFQRL